MGNDKKRVKRASHRDIYRWLILVLTSLIISIFLFPNFLSRPKKVYKIGDVAEEDVKATRDILVEDKDRSEKDREEAVNRVPYVYDFDPSASNLAIRLREAMSEARKVFTVSPVESEVPIPIDQIPIETADEIGQVKTGFFQILEINPDEKLFEKLVENRFSEVIEKGVISIVVGIFKKGVVGNKTVLLSQSQKGVVLQSIEDQTDSLVTDLTRFYDIEGAKSYIKERRKELIEQEIEPKQANLIIDIAMSLIKPNVTFNKRETELRKDTARKSVKPTYYQIKKGEMLVREGERINPAHISKLSELTKLEENQVLLGRVPGMTVLIGILFSVVYITGLIKPKHGSNDIKHLLFNTITLLSLFIFIWLYDFIAEEIARGFHSFTPRALIFSMPVACGAMLITIFQGLNAAVIFSVLISVLVSLVIDGNVEFLIYFFVSSVSAAYLLREYRERGILIKVGLKVGLINIMLSLAMESIYGSLFTIEALVALIAGFVGGMLAGVISTGIIPLVEMSFGFTTDIKLLELANLDQPLLRNLMVQAPGTYHHSVIVSNMVEATAKAIHANPLLAKVSAYYHDIGKMKKPLYFIENQMGGENRHEKLAPSMSSLVLISHVKDGVELAKKHKLGKEIIDIIQQHQGKGLITYFYQKAKENASNKGAKSFEVKEDDFRYPGPKPQTKEAGLVMLADMVEAASRSLSDPTPARIRGTVQKIVNKVFSDGQLDECELTLKDLHEIAKSFNKTLSGIFHQRVEYPDTDSTKTSKKTGNGDTDQIIQEDTRTKKSDDKARNGEGLKRLGM